MNTKTAETYLPCYRTGTRMDSRIIKAAHVAEADDLLREKLDLQLDFDEQMVEVIHSIHPPENLREKLGVLVGKPPGELPLRSQLLHPAMLAVVAGAVLIVGFLVWTEMERREAFPGRESVERMLSIASDMTGVELEPARGRVGDLGDHFYMRGYEGFVLPPELANLPAAGSRVYKQAGHPVAQVAIDSHNALLYVFRASNFGIDLGKDGGWRIIAKDQWVAAVRERYGVCTMLALRGTKREMKELLTTLGL